MVPSYEETLSSPSPLPKALPATSEALIIAKLKTDQWWNKKKPVRQMDRHIDFIVVLRCSIYDFWQEQPTDLRTDTLIVMRERIWRRAYVLASKTKLKNSPRKLFTVEIFRQTISQFGHGVWALGERFAINFWSILSRPNVFFCIKDVDCSLTWEVVIKIMEYIVNVHLDLFLYLFEKG